MMPNTGFSGRVLALLGGIYILVRGLGNMNKRRETAFGTAG